jgi:hypothetical protein
MKKFIKCFTEDKANELKNKGFVFLYEQNGIWFFEWKEIIDSDVEISNLLNF